MSYISSGRSSMSSGSSRIVAVVVVLEAAAVFHKVTCNNINIVIMMVVT
jgi:hypothetical protein